jgi:hypothetical protein
LPALPDDDNLSCTPHYDGPTDPFFNHTTEGTPERHYSSSNMSQKAAARNEDNAEDAGNQQL